MRVLAVLCFALCIGVAPPAFAQADLSKTIDLALENFDLGDYSAAKAQLEGALENAGGDAATVARGHLVLGAVYYELGNEAGAKAAFGRALAADESVRPEPRYANAAVISIFDAVAEQRKAANSCEGIPAIAHDRGPRPKAGKPYELTCRAGDQLGEVSLVVFYRTANLGAYTKKAMDKTGDCTWTAQLPALDGEQLEYHFAALNESGRKLAGHGSQDSPNSLAIEAAVETPPTGKRAEDEVPDELGGRRPAEPRGKGCAGCSGTGTGGPLAAVLLCCALLAGLRRNSLSS
jgi:tetratricopeptide (TPR) repeat protein